MSSDDRFDGMFMNLAQQCRGIDPLLDSVFGFLRRKTDFFTGPPGQSNGPEMAVAKVMEIVEKHRKIAGREMEEKAKKKENVKEKKRKEKEEKAKVEAKKTSSPSPSVLEVGGDGGFDLDSTPSVNTSPPPAPSNAPKSTENDVNVETEGDDDDDDGTPPPEGNGGLVDGKYKWTQTLSEVSVSIPVPKGTKGRDLNVVMKKQYLQVSVKGHTFSGGEIKGPLTKSIVVDDSFWTLEDNEFVVVNMQKLNGMEWWSGVLTGDPTINTQKVQPENSKLADLDGDTRQTVEKMMHDQRQKALNLPTADEQKKIDILEKFKQQHPEMDFSKAKFS